MGGVIDGISMILSAGNHLDNGAFREGSYSRLPLRPAWRTPAVAAMSTSCQRPASPGGAGELVVPAAAAAVANAYARATGTNPRSFPITC